MSFNVAVLGFGTVGSGVAEVLSMNRDSIARKTGKDIVLKHILDLRDFLTARMLLWLHTMPMRFSVTVN